MKRYIYSSYDLNQFNEYQQKQIKKGLESGVDVSVYADPKFDQWQMDQLREGLESGVDVSVYADPRFDYRQMWEIREGLESGVDVSVYADPKFNEWEMREIREGLKSGVDVSVYADPKFNSGQMCAIRLGLQDGLDVSVYADPKFDGDQMIEILEGLKKGLDPVSSLAPFTNKELIKMLNDAGIDTTKCKYELRAESYERYANGRVYTRKFTCPGDWLAYFSMCFHRQPTAALVDEYFGGEDFEEEYIDSYPTIDAIADYASKSWWGDGDDYIIHLKNLTTGQILYSADEYEEEFEDDEWED